MAKGEIGKFKKYNLKGTETEKSLLKSFAGESQARNRYTYFSSIAKKEGFEQIAAIFEDTANNEKEHAEVFFKYLEKSEGKPIEISAAYPAGKIGTTKENLMSAAEGERVEYGQIYPSFQKIAEEEGFREIAISFREIAEVEEGHEKRYLKLLENLKNKTVFKKSIAEDVKWRCRNCGYIHVGNEAPEECPACKHPQDYYEIIAENY